MTKVPFIYLGSPYTHDDPKRVESRVKCITAIIAELTLLFGDRIVFYSPIVHSHPIQKEINSTELHESHTPPDWLEIDKQILLRVDGVCFVKIKGWEESEGMQVEREFCDKHGIPYVYASFNIARVIEAVWLQGNKTGEAAEKPELARVEVLNAVSGEMPTKKTD